MGALREKAVVITGAGRGLGRAYAHHAADAGAAVVVNDVDGGPAEEVAAEIASAGGRAVACVGSVADPRHADELVERCVAEFGRLDGLVNNAAVGYHVPPWEDTDPARTRALLETNVLGSFACGVAAIRHMHAQGSGSIVNVTSGSMVGQRGAAAYSASKGAVASLTFSWASDLAPHGVRVNAVCPIAWTRMMAADPNHRSGPHQSPDRIAPLVTYLLSDLSAAVTGQVLRLAVDALHVVRQPAVKHPVLRREAWDVDAVAAAVADELDLEPPARERWSL
ncbi:SDR family NAD(P)-dependent oxidoreductase [Amycolatopsis sp. NPDC051903]|uniref:SDR family NAD(P)-dependent oxidoreductase n=1 Tax=Amycolatopsis sp. NPDC051903 TaxID=3363936 RepID=UPI00379607DB